MKRDGRLTAAICLVVLAGLLAIRARAPWRYLHDDNGRRYSSYARTHIALGLAATGGRDFFYDPRDGRMVPYGHHPPGLGLLLAGWFRLLGSDTPGAARALPALFHLTSAALMLGLLGRHFPGPPGLVAGLVFAVVPMSSYFGKMVNFEPLVLPFLIGAVIAWWRFAEGGRPAWAGLAILLVALGTLVDWPILLAPLVFAGDGVRRWRRGEGGGVLVAGAAAVVVALAVVVPVATWAASAVGPGELAKAASYRARLHGQYRWWQLAGKLIDYNRRYFTEPVLVASVVAAGMLVGDAWRRRPFTPRARLLALFGVVGILPVVGFPTSARYHAYWQFPLLPFATLAVAFVLERLGARLSPSRRRLVYASVALWVVAASAAMLHMRYTRPSGYVARQIRQFQHYL